MSQAAKALPVGWTQVLDDVQARLDLALARVDARIEKLPPSEGADQRLDRLRENVAWADRLTRLGAFLESAEQVVQSVDEILQEELTRMQETQAASETLRQRLAEGTGRAIG